MDVMLLHEFRGLEQIQRDILLRFLRARLRFAGFETVREENGGYELQRGCGTDCETVLAVEIDPTGNGDREAESVICAALLRVMEESAAWENSLGSVKVILAPTGCLPNDLRAVKIEPAPEVLFGSVSVLAEDMEAPFVRACIRAAELVSKPELCKEEGAIVSVRVGYANNGSPYRIHPLAMEHVADVTRELLRLRHGSSY